MQSISVSLTLAVFLALIALLIAATAAPVEIVGTLQNVNGSSPPGKITAIQEGPHLTFATCEVEEDGRFRFTGESMEALELHAAAIEPPPAERVIAAGTTGVVTVTLVQDVHVRIGDAEGTTVEEVELQVRYYEPKKPSRMVMVPEWTNAASGQEHRIQLR
ncbi:MAG: hypothetical protein OXH92_11840 [Bryobacterales bacterium]|nr:hypothetical protein [bacterium]MDE0434685.1 hypothetical protein [Bryobacterales bacterium]